MGVIWGLVIIAGLYLLHRLGLWMEDRGWLYYQRKRGSSCALGGAMLEVQALFEPGYQHVLEERRSERYDEAEEGDPPHPDEPFHPPGKYGAPAVAATIVKNARA